MSDQRDPRRPVTVRFLRTWRNYCRDDCAAFAAPDARRLINRGLAELVRVAPDGETPPPGVAWPWATRPPQAAPPARGGGPGEDDFAL